MGYRWRVAVRITPMNGAPKTIWLDGAMAWAGGPIEVNVGDPELVSEKRETINRKRVDLFLGLRLRIKLKFAIGDDMADHAVYSEILNALLDDRKLVELSLDNGVVYREVILDAPPKGPTPFKGRAAAGAEFELSLVTADLVTSTRPIQYGRW